MYIRNLLSVLFLILFFQGRANAQFEGNIAFEVTNLNDQSESPMLMDLTFTQDRIFIDTNISMDVMAGLRAQSVLVRHDVKDFVVITDDEEGLKVTQDDIQSLINIMNQVQGKEEVTSREPFPWEERLIDTGEIRNLHGYPAQQFILKGDSENEYVSVWLTDNIKVDWGLLEEAWFAIGSKQIDQEVPVEIVMNSQSFPLLVEVFENDRVTLRAESVSVDPNTFDRTKTTLSPNLKMVGLTDLMMNMFRQN